MKQFRPKITGRQQTSLQHQKGVALIVALIITTIAIVLASATIYRQQLHIRLTGNISNLEQAYQYATGMEDWAGTILETDYKNNPKMDSLEENWATLLPPIPIPGGSMNGQLFDLQARINLNSLNRQPQTITVPNNNENTNNSVLNPNFEDEEDDEKILQGNNPPTNAQTVKIDIAQITSKRLENLIKVIDPNQELWTTPAKNFPEIVKDWIDSDDINGNLDDPNSGSGGGAESPHYLSNETPYFSANSLLASPTELRLLKDMQDPTYVKLLPFLNTLPLQDNKKANIETPVNINTAPVEVLKALGFDDIAAENIINLRSKKQKPEDKYSGFADINDFLNLDDVKAALNQNPPAISKDNLSVSSNFFLLQGMIKINNSRLFVNSVLYRQNGKVSVIMRDFSNPQTITTSSN